MKSCLKGPRRQLRNSLLKSVFFPPQKKQIRQICTENLRATLPQIKSSSFELVLSSATRGCKGTIRNYLPSMRRWATRAQSCFFQTQQEAFCSCWQHTNQSLSITHTDWAQEENHVLKHCLSLSPLHSALHSTLSYAVSHLAFGKRALHFCSGVKVLKCNYDYLQLPVHSFTSIS